MPHDVDLSVGGDTSAVAASFGELKNYGVKAREELSHEFSKAIAFTGLIIGMEEVINKAHEIHHESERFGVDAQGLQLIANAAKEDGIQLDAVARSLNRLGIISAETPKHLRDLNITMEEWQAMDPAERFLRLADALKELGLNSETYTATVGLMGARFGGELIPVLLKGREAIEGVGKSTVLMSDDTVESLDRAYGAWQNFKTNLEGASAPAIALVLKGLSAGVVSLGAVLAGTAEAAIGHFKAIARAATGDFAGASKAIDESAKKVGEIKDKWVKDMDVISGNVSREKRPPFGVDTAPDMTGFGDGTAGGHGAGGATGSTGGGGAKESTALIDRLAEHQRKYDLDQLDSADKLKSLELERQELQDNLNAGIEQGVLSQEEQAGIQDKLLTNDEERQKIQDEMDKAQDVYNQKLSEERQAAEDAAAASERRVQIMQLEATGHADIAQKLQTQWELEDKIADLTDRINEAWSEGAQTLAEQLTDLRDQLETEEKITQQVDAQNKARADAAARARAAREGWGINPGSEAQLRAQEAGIQLGGDVARDLATNPTTGKVNEALFKQLQARENAAFLQGKDPWSFIDRARANYNVTHSSQIASSQSEARDAAANRAQVQYWNSIASGINPAIAKGTLDAALQRIYGFLSSIDSRLTPTPGGH